MSNRKNFSFVELFCAVLILTILSAIALPSLLPASKSSGCAYAHTDPEYEFKTGYLLRLQTIRKMDSGEFAKSIQELREDPLFSESVKEIERYGAYQASMEVKNNLVVTYATPKPEFKDRYKRYSYAKATIWDDNTNKATQIISCRTRKPQTTRISAPTLKNGSLSCGVDSSEKLCGQEKWSRRFNRFVGFPSNR
ncbi:MAG: hypothetical protein F6J87_13560 [Spirulina sp. SIO3F2]|nr:hypothetical protein [Spirulina sp. SIO3F2]